MKAKKLKSWFIRCVCAAFALILCIQSFGGSASASNTVTFSEEETAFISAVENSASAGKINHWGAWNNAISLQARGIIKGPSRTTGRRRPILKMRARQTWPCCSSIWESATSL